MKEKLYGSSEAGGTKFVCAMGSGLGHIRIPHDPNLDPFLRGVCPCHGDCFEGLASGPAVQARFVQRAETLKNDDVFWDVEAGYIVYALTNYILILAPKKIILGGGTVQNDFMFTKIWVKQKPC